MLKHLFDTGILKEAVRVSAVVGTILNLVNQGPLAWKGEPISWVQLLLNYVVPFCVSTYSGARSQARIRLGSPPE